MRRLRMLGVPDTAEQRATATGYPVTGFGLRYQMSAINAAIGNVQLDHFADLAAVRRRLWRTYASALSRLTDVALIDADPIRSVPSLCVVRVPDRDRVHGALRARGIGVGVHYPPNHLQPAFAAWHRPLPATEEAGREILTLPFHPHLTEDEIEGVADTLGQVLHTPVAHQ